MPKIVDHERRRNEIAAAACGAIAKRGLDGVTLADVAREAGCTTGMLAHYYSTKWDLILAALRLMHMRLEKRLSQRLKSEKADLVELLRDALPIDAQHKAEAAAWLTFWGVALSKPDLLKWSSQTHADWLSLVRRCVIETVEDARTWRSDLLDHVVSSIVLFMDGIYVKALTRPNVYPPKEQILLLRTHLEATLLWARNNADVTRSDRLSRNKRQRRGTARQSQSAA